MTCTLLLLALLGFVQADPGQDAFERGDLTQALILWTDALQVARSQHDADQVFTRSLQLAAALRDAGRPISATRLLNGVRATRPAQSTQLHLSVGLNERSKGNNALAKRFFREAVRVAQTGELPQDGLNAAFNLGLAQLESGELDAAVATLSAGLRVATALGDSLAQGECHAALGRIARQQSHLRQARSHLERAIQLIPAEHPSRADTYTALAHLLDQIGRPDQAVALYQEALRSAQRRADVSRQALLFQRLAELLLRQHKTAEARRSFQLASDGFSETGDVRGQISVGLALATLNDAPLQTYRDLLNAAQPLNDRQLQATLLLHMAQIQPADGLKWLQEAQSHASSIGDQNLLWRILSQEARLLLSRGQREKAQRHYEQARLILDGLGASVSPHDSTPFQQSESSVYQGLIRLATDAGQPLLALSYAQTLQQRAHRVPPPDLQQREEAYHRLVRQLAHAQAAEAKEAVEVLTLRVDQSRIDFAATVDHLRTADPDFEREQTVSTDQLEAIQRQLDPGVAVLQPILLTDRLILLLFTRDAMVAKTIEGSTEPLIRAIQTLARLMQTGSTSAVYTEKLADQIGAQLIAPLSSSLKDTRLLAVAATGPFQQLPFSLLRVDHRYLIEQMAVVSINNAASLTPPSAPFQLVGARTVLVGDPDGSLPFAQKEVLRIASVLTRPTQLIGEAAGHDPVLLALKGKEVLHLATHGRLDPQFPSRSHLVLARDEQLSYSEIPGLIAYLDPLRLVVLSACSSALPVKAQAEPNTAVVASINGLAAQFRRAGVETLLGSLWEVDDQSTGELMARFYSELSEGEDMAQALRTAQLALLKQPRFEHPWYWAAFTLLGDWR